MKQDQRQNDLLKHPNMWVNIVSNDSSHERYVLSSDKIFKRLTESVQNETLIMSQKQMPQLMRWLLVFPMTIHFYVELCMKYFKDIKFS
ncbi:hypothetical protein OAS44_02605 [Flavobacteriaceae bacterium]|jgi:hypothetical protein|nr:hypothetical protein [Flavobacteriaceae bacterium]